MIAVLDLNANIVSPALSGKNKKTPSLGRSLPYLRHSPAWETRSGRLTNKIIRAGVLSSRMFRQRLREKRRAGPGRGSRRRRGKNEGISDR